MTSLLPGSKSISLIFGKYSIILLVTAAIIFGTFSTVISSEEMPSGSLIVGITIYPEDLEDENETEKGPPKFLIDRPAVVIRTSYSQETLLYISEHLQKNMIVRWHNRAEPENDIEFKSENLVLIGQNNFLSGGVPFGITFEAENSNLYIPAEAVLMKTSFSDGYENMNDFRAVLSANEEKSELEFKLDEDYLLNEEIQLEPGIYRGDIISNYSFFGRSPHIIVKVENNLDNSNNSSAPGYTARNIVNSPENVNEYRGADILAELLTENILCELYVNEYNLEILTSEVYEGGRQEIEIPGNYRRIIQVEIYQVVD